MMAESEDTPGVGRFLDAMAARYGYDLRAYARASLDRRVRGALAATGCVDVDELTQRALADPACFARVLDLLTVQVTEMFRDPEFFRALRARVVPLLRTYPLINVWVCGCASGEEAYSMAVLFAEEGLLDRLQIYATDLSPRAIEQAKQGIYAEDRLPGFAENHRAAGGKGDLADHTTAAYGGIAFAQSLRRRILFFQHDLVNDQAFGEMQLVTCRNVLIYFGRDLRERVLEKFSHSLCPAGFLGLGSSERLSAAGYRLFSDFDDHARLYRHQVPAPGGAPPARS